MNSPAMPASAAMITTSCEPPQSSYPPAARWTPAPPGRRHNVRKQTVEEDPCGLSEVAAIAVIRGLPAIAA